MQLIRLLISELQTSRRRLILMIIVSGLANAGVLAVVNAGTNQDSHSRHAMVSVALFALIIVVYVFSQRYIMITAAGEVETTVHRIRSKLIDKLLRCELLDIEITGRARLYASLGKDTQTLSQFATPLVLGSQAAVLVVFAMSYLAWLSFANFLLCIAYLGTITRLYMRRTQNINVGLHEALSRENELQDALTDMLDGFKEVKMDSRRRDAIEREANIISEDASWKRIGVQVQMARNFVFTQAAFFLLLAANVFIMPMFGIGQAASPAKTITAILFLSGPISGLVACMPALANANVAAENILALDRLLGGLVENLAHAGVNRPGTLIALPLQIFPAEFSEITFDGVVFSHVDAAGGPGFVVGPLNLSFKAGEITFITGGNGSGKSTLLKLLTALYQADSGTILLDGVPIRAHNAQGYRDLFSTVFSDYHLFSRLYGMATPDPKDLAGRIADFELDGKTSFEADRFRTLDLSAGQRRRLALLVAQLEAKRICVLDEWAADQDPAFRRKFYLEILPAMKAQGITVIAVTHDDRYFHVCDRHIRMDEGRVTEIEASTQDV